MHMPMRQPSAFHAELVLIRVSLRAQMRRNRFTINISDPEYPNNTGRNHYLWITAVAVPTFSINAQHISAETISRRSSTFPLAAPSRGSGYVHKGKHTAWCNLPLGGPL